MRPEREYWRLRRFLEGVVKEMGHESHQLPILYYGAMVAMQALNSRDEDPIDAFERLRVEHLGLIDIEVG